MADPFAHLLDSFKKNETSTNNNKLKEENKPNNGNNNANTKQDVSSVNILSPNKIMEPLIPSNSLFVPNSINPIESNNINSNINSSSNNNSNSNSNKDDDWDKAYSIFNNVSDATSTNTTTLPQLSNNNTSTDISTNIETKDENLVFSTFQSSSIVDEVKDMEIARIMSLGYSFNKSLQFYENGLDYDTISLKQKYHKINKNNNCNNNNNRITNINPFSNDQNESFTNTLTNMFNKSKHFVKSLNLTDFNKGFDVDRYKGGFNVLNSYSDANSINTNDYGYSPSISHNHSLIKEDDEKMSLTNNKTISLSVSPSPPVLIEDQNDNQISEDDNQVLLDWDAPVNNQTPDTTTSTIHSSMQPQITDIELISYEEFKNNATNLFKNGHYADALEQYTKSLNTLPKDHPLRLIAISNIMISQLKIGEYNNIIKLLDACKKLWPNNTDENNTTKSNWKQIIPNSKPQRTFKDIWIKIMLRCAESYRHLEDFNNELDIYKQLLGKNVTTNKVLDGKRRCEKILYPEKFKSTSKKTNSEMSPLSSTIIANTKSALNSKTSSPSIPKNTENVDKIKKQNAKLEKESILKEKLYDQVTLKIDQWKSNKPTDIRHLLSNLQQVVTWTSWTPVSLTDLVMPKKVKVTYLKAASKTHPDKVPNSLDLENKMIAENVFSTLSKAWELFKGENNI